MPLLTVVIPSFNSAATIRECLSSLAGQDFIDFEVVIMDNNSRDQTVQICLEFDMQPGLLRVNSEKDNGIYDAMNKGIALAKGEWVYFMGADDELYEKNTLKDVALYLTADHDIVYGDCLWVPEGKPERGEWTPEVFIQANINHQRIFYRKTLFGQYGNYNTDYKIASDHELNIRFFCNGNIRKKYIPHIISKYHSGGFSANKLDEKFWQDWETIVLKNFGPYLPKKIIYGSLFTYFRWLVDKDRKKEAVAILWKHFKNTASPGFLKLAISYWLKK